MSNNPTTGISPPPIPYLPTIQPSTPPPLGGGDRDRTDDLLLAKQALSQLSYAPDPLPRHDMVGPGRLELPTSRLSGVRSNHLSYEPGLPENPRINPRNSPVIAAKGYAGGGLNRPSASHSDF